ncbi:hypothetical protein EVAR_19296_1 [Eumeta japonica]|uniref:Uncharacterized protein n=1 Tax=Eumeta variegata TaxID=151549 RepID=A0A4C1UE62_EUMVA|nr:hypothetical protein EVAR_19296_1 [Eumeta japonica]
MTCPYGDSLRDHLGICHWTPTRIVSGSEEGFEAAPKQLFGGRELDGHDDKCTMACHSESTTCSFHINQK